MSAPPPEERELKREPDFVLRSNRFSGVLTLAMLVATVVTVYLVFPRRDNQLMTRTTEMHRSAAPFDLDRPNAAELAAWSAGVLEKGGVPLPAPGADVEVIGATATEITRRRAAMVRYAIRGIPVTLVVQRARDAPPRMFRRTDGADTVISWRASKFTVAAIGPTATAQTWAPIVGAPH